MAVPGGHLLLGLTDIQRGYLSRVGLAEMQPPADPDYPLWRRERVPTAAESDGLYGTFLGTLGGTIGTIGTIGTWDEAYGPEEGVHASLFAFLQETANRLEGVSSGDWSGSGKSAGRRRLDARHSQSFAPEPTAVAGPPRSRPPSLITSSCQALSCWSAVAQFSMW